MIIQLQNLKWGKGEDDVFAGVSIGWGENTICRESSRVVEL
jgi:hypothetical protein